MSQKANEMLSDYQQDDFTVKLLSSLDSIVPGSPGFKFYNSFEDGVKAYVPDATPEVIEKARQIAESEEMMDALKVMGYIDTSDKVIAGYAGIKNVLSLFGGGGGAKKKKVAIDTAEETMSKEEKRRHEAEVEELREWQATRNRGRVAEMLAIRKRYRGEIEEYLEGE